MRILFLNLLFVFLFFGCNKPQPESGKNPDSISITDSSQVPVSDPSNVPDKSQSNIITPNDVVIRTVFVKDKAATPYWKQPDMNSKPAGYFEFGTKLKVVEFKDSIPAGQSSFWLKVRSLESLEVCYYGDAYLVSGFVPSSVVIDSAEAGSTLIPSRLVFTHEQPKRNFDKLKFTIDTITIKKYQEYKKDYDNKIVIDTTKRINNREFFTLMIAGKLIKFSCNYICDCDYYLGYVKPLKAYGIMNCDEVCWTYLVMEETGQTCSLESNYDTESSLPLLLKDESMFVTFSNEQFAYPETSIMLYRKDPKSNKFRFNEYEAFSVKDYKIAELVWIDAKSMALKVYEQDGYPDEKTKYKYLRATMKK